MKRKIFWNSIHPFRLKLSPILSTNIFLWPRTKCSGFHSTQDIKYKCKARVQGCWLFEDLRCPQMWFHRLQWMSGRKSLLNKLTLQALQCKTGPNGVWAEERPEIPKFSPSLSEDLEVRTLAGPPPLCRQMLPSLGDLLHKNLKKNLNFF